MTVEHLPVLIREVVDVLSPHEGGIYVDSTIGLGGHSEEILKMIGHDGRIVGIDRDPEALKRASLRLNDRRLLLKKGGFSEMDRLLRSEGITEVDGILFDLGVSMMQLKDMGRGFSFMSQDSLDMRMDPDQDFSAWDVINGYSEKDLIRIMKDYGEEYRATRIAKAIVDARGKKSIDKCSELEDIIFRAIGRHGRVHPATRTFQAVRIEVNRELEELKQALNASIGLLKKGGRICVISYHSLEDRIVKNFIRDNAKDKVLKALMKKPVVPAITEVRGNPSSRSAKLRGAEKL